ncbi:MAG TPA: four helix bundle protein [Ignavibacteriaceae bacterium]|nr:four helix bundle protein [Ignavibacteriaceae bacterium]
MKLEELRVYQLSMSLADEVWDIVINWDHFAKDVVGKQLIKAVDSVAANLSEGFGRFFYKEERQFCYYSRGSLYETKTWLTKASNRKLISNEEFEKFMKEINDIGVKLNNYINSIGKKNSEFNKIKLTEKNNE